MVHTTLKILLYLLLLILEITIAVLVIWYSRWEYENELKAEYDRNNTAKPYFFFGLSYDVDGSEQKGIEATGKPATDHLVWIIYGVFDSGEAHVNTCNAKLPQSDFQRFNEVLKFGVKTAVQHEVEEKNITVNFPPLELQRKYPKYQVFSIETENTKSVREFLSTRTKRSSNNQTGTSCTDSLLKWLNFIIGVDSKNTGVI